MKKSFSTIAAALISTVSFCATVKATTQQITLKQQIAAEQATLEKLQTSQESYQKQFAKQNAALAKQIRTLYKLDKTQTLKTVLNADNVDNLNRHLAYSHYLNNARLNRIIELKQTLDTLSSTILAINKHQQKLQSLLEQKQKYQDSFPQEQDNT